MWSNAGKTCSLGWGACQGSSTMIPNQGQTFHSLGPQSDSHGQGPRPVLQATNFVEPPTHLSVMI